MIHQIRAWYGRTLATALLLAAILLPAAAFAQLLPNSTSGEIDSIVALVDEDIILRSELDQAIAGIVQQIRARGEAMPPMHLLESQVLERLIITELQVQRALQTGIRVSDADIDQYLVNIAQSNNITVQQMRQSIEADGMEFAEFRRNIGEQINDRAPAATHRQRHGSHHRYRGRHPAGLRG